MRSTHPVDAGNFIPHQTPVLMVNSILEWNDEKKSSLIKAFISKKSPFINSKGLLDNECFLEIIAQAAAAQHGFNLFRQNKPKEQGFIAGVNFLNVLKPAKAETTLLVKVECGTEISSLSVVNGEILSETGILHATATITVWHGTF